MSGIVDVWEGRTVYEWRTNKEGHFIRKFCQGMEERELTKNRERILSALFVYSFFYSLTVT